MTSAKFPHMGTNDHELSKLDTIGLASKIREGEISPTEAVQYGIIDNVFNKRPINSV